MKASVLPELLLVENSLDDEVMWLEVVLSLSVPCRVTVRRHGTEALDYLLDADKPLPTAVVLDNRRPEPDAFEIPTRLRIHDRTRSIPVVLFNGISVSKSQQLSCTATPLRAMLEPCYT